MALDPADLWPDPPDCPDWPIISESNMRHMTLHRGRRPAEAQLDAIGRLLNRDARNLRRPTDAERADMASGVFKAGNTTNLRWIALGITDRMPVGPIAEAEAERIVEAAHLRGYLRKLDAQDAAAAEEKERREREQAQRAVDGYSTAVTNGLAELETLAEAVARHEQRLADEKAVHRAREIRQALGMGHTDAVRAARALGVAPPAAPQFD